MEVKELREAPGLGVYAKVENDAIVIGNINDINNDAPVYLTYVEATRLCDWLKNALANR
jgi:hypothetical protein